MPRSKAAPHAAAWAGADTRLGRLGGEFRAPALEAAYQDEHAAETVRHSRIGLIAAAVLNTLFLVSDWRFVGTPHFWVAVPARLFVIAVALACLGLVVRFPRRVPVQRIMIGWMALTAAGVAALVTSHSDIALFVVMLLPAIYYLAVAVAFRWTLAGGVYASLMMYAAYENFGPTSMTAPGIALALVMLNTTLTLNVSRSNRLARLAWLAIEGERRLSDALSEHRRSLERMFAACPVPLVLTEREDGRVLRMSDSCSELLGTAQPWTLRQFYASDGEADGLLAALERGAGEAEFETPVRLPTGAERTLLIKSSFIDLNGQPLVMSGLLDITERKAAQVNLELLASTDPLTGLRNRLSFFAAARAEMMRAARSQTMLAMLMIDIDHFKQINDTAGHHAGDIALRAFAMLCVAQLGRRAVIGRLGGEEFGVLLPQTGPGTAALVAESLCEQVAAMHVDAGREHPIRLTVSIGVAGVRADDRDIDAALARADLALYAAKRGGRNRVVADEPDPTTRRSA